MNQRQVPSPDKAPISHEETGIQAESLTIAAAGVHLVAAEGDYRNGDSVIVNLSQGPVRYKVVAEEKPKEFEDEHTGIPSGPQTGSTSLKTRTIFEDEMTLARRPEGAEHNS